MANLRKSNFDLEERVCDALRLVVPERSSIVVGLSGGLDSVVLLHLLFILQSRFGFTLSALHVHHGISQHADAWANFCTELCKQYDVSLKVTKVNVELMRADHGVESAARQLRYAEYAKLKADFVALAHHQDDQVETLLLQLARGSGVRGVAAMPLLKNSHPATLRPLLDIPRGALFDYAQHHALQWVEDESNSDEHYSRNFLRHRVLPVLEEKFPAYRQTFTRSAQHFAEAAALMDDLARLDAEIAAIGDRLKVNVFNALSATRAKNLLRYFIEQQGAPLPDSSRLQEMLKQLNHLRRDGQMCISWSGWELRCYQNQIHLVKTTPTPEHFEEVIWSGEELLELPQLGGVLSFVPTLSAGLSVDKLRQHGMTIRHRQGGESIRVWRNAHHRSLKNIFQENQVPPWERESIPLLFSGDELICVPGVVSAEDFRAKESEHGVLVSWQRLHYDARAEAVQK